MGRHWLRAVLVALSYLFLPAAVFAPLPALAQAAAGDQVCAGCHQAQMGIANTKHGVTGDARTPFGSGKSCTACHGDSSAHLQDPAKNKPAVRFGKGHDALPQSEACMSCHQGGKQIHWAGSAHDRTQVSCSGCHSVHAPKDQVLVKETQAGVCYTCHKDVRAATMRFSSHPLRQGLMTCTSCHAPHGSVAEHQMVRNTVNETCYTCHAAQRGPFLWEHPASREDCGNCHSPHGSNNAPLLKARGPYLCQQCHLNPFHPSTLYSGNNLPPNLAADKMLGQNCMNCHPKVHGSNHPSGARFTR